MSLDNLSPLSEETAAELLRLLLQKQGNWVDWGKACQKLQKAGYTPQEIFEQTGFQGSQQNAIVVAAQVYDSLAQSGAEPELLAYFQGPRSDILYELRLLNQEQRLTVGTFARDRQLDVDGAKEVVKAVRAFSALSQVPEEFTPQPGDAIAYQCWKQAKEKKDLAERSRFIAKGLKFASSQTAREALEKLLGQLAKGPTATAPLLPVYRLEAEEQLARLVPVAGHLPLTKKKVEAVLPVEIAAPFSIAQNLKQQKQIVALPGWQAVLKATDPVAILCQSDELPRQLPGSPETVLVAVDRAEREWDINSYFLVEQKKNLTFQWFPEAPKVTLLGKVILVLRPKNILDENNLLEPWQMDD